jgi:hypothetical protein
LIGDTFKALITPFLNLLMTVYCIYYIWGTVGDRLVGGLVYNNDLRFEVNPALPSNFVLMNMNDLIASFITLFALMVVNNWYVTTDVLVTVWGDDSIKWFSILFYFFCVVISLNILLAFVIDMYGNVASIYRMKIKDELGTVESKE